MKEKYYVIVFVLLNVSFLNFACKLQFINDLDKAVFIADDLGKGVFLNPGAMQEIDPAKTGFWKYLSKERIYIYQETDEKDKLELVYRIIDDYCTDDANANALRLSDINNKNEKITQRFRIKEYKA